MTKELRSDDRNHFTCINVNGGRLLEEVNMDHDAILSCFSYELSSDSSQRTPHNLDPGAVGQIIIMRIAGALTT
jgi:hypothetical protein